MKNVTGNTAKKEIKVLYYNGKKVVEEHDDIVVSNVIDYDLIALKVAMILAIILAVTFVAAMVYIYTPIGSYISNFLYDIGLIEPIVVNSN